jgi:hypothetical protein
VAVPQAETDERVIGQLAKVERRGRARFLLASGGPQIGGC